MSGTIAEVGIHNLIFRHLLFSVFSPNARHSAPERSARLGSPSLGLEHGKGSASGEPPQPPLTFCRAREGAGPEGAGRLGKPLQPSHARVPGVMLNLLMLQGSRVG